MKKAFSLIELLVSIVIMAILAVGFTKIIQMLYVKKAQAKYITKFSYDSQLVLDQISGLLSKRIHFTTIAYDPDCGTSGIGHFEGIDADMNSTAINLKCGGRSLNASVLEWYPFSYDSRMRGAYQPYAIKTDATSAPTTITLTKLNNSEYNNIENKLSGFSNNYDDLMIILPTSIGGDTDALNRTLGWHKTIYDPVYMKQVTDIHSNIIDIKSSDKILNNVPENILLVNSAYAIARGEHLTQSEVTNCNIGSELTATIGAMNPQEFENTLFLFHGYLPWKTETFCMDKNDQSSTISREGIVSILAQNLVGFEVESKSSNLIFKIKMSKNVRGMEANITFLKQKVMY